MDPVALSTEDLANVVQKVCADAMLDVEPRDADLMSTRRPATTSEVVPTIAEARLNVVQDV